MILCFSPPLNLVSFVYHCVIALWKPHNKVVTYGILAACIISSSVASGFPIIMLSRMLFFEQERILGHKEIWDIRSIADLVQRYAAHTNLSLGYIPKPADQAGRCILPLPETPASAVTFPSGTVNETSLITGCSSP